MTCNFDLIFLTIRNSYMNLSFNNNSFDVASDSEVHYNGNIRQIKDGINTEFHVTGELKMADIVTSNTNLLLVIERFGIPLGFGNKTVFGVCKEHNLDSRLVMAVMNISINKNYPVQESLSYGMLPGLITYLKNAHDYYLDHKLPFINDLIDRFIQNTENPNTRLIKSFFNEYAKEVEEHMNLENDTVFPYIETVYTSFVRKEEPGQRDYSIRDFVEHHSDIDEKLDDLVHLLIKHFPPTKERYYRNEILLELSGLQDDLNDHAGLENLILVPLVRELEYKLRLHGEE